METKDGTNGRAQTILQEIGQWGNGDLGLPAAERHPHSTLFAVVGPRTPPDVAASSIRKSTPPYRSPALQRNEGAANPGRSGDELAMMYSIPSGAIECSSLLQNRPLRILPLRNLAKAHPGPVVITVIIPAL